MSRRTRIVTLTLPLVEMASNLYARWCAVDPKDRNVVARVLKFKGEDQMSAYIRKAIKVGTDGFKGDTSEADQLYQLTVKLNKKLDELGYDSPIARSNPDKDKFSFLQLLPVIEGDEPEIDDPEIEKWYARHAVKNQHYGIQNRVAEQVLPQIKLLDISVKSLAFYRDKAVKAQTAQEQRVATEVWNTYKQKLEQYGEPDEDFRIIWHRYLEAIMRKENIFRQRMADILFWEFHNHQDMRNLSKQCWGVWNFPAVGDAKFAPELLEIVKRQPHQTQEVKRKLVGLHYNMKLSAVQFMSFRCEVEVQRWYEHRNGEELARDIVMWHGELPPFVKVSDKYPKGMIALVAFGEPETQPGMYSMVVKQFLAKAVVATLTRHAIG